MIVLAPTLGVDVSGVWVAPVVVSGGPAIEMDQQLSFTADFTDGGHAD